MKSEKTLFPIEGVYVDQARTDEVPVTSVRCERGRVRVCESEVPNGKMVRRTGFT